MNQRIGRVSRIGQESQCINVINLIAKQSIEERILAGIQLKTDLFKGVFEQGPDQVEFSREKIETVLNSGMEFIAGLMEMATGQKMEKTQGREKMIEIDKNTGEVTMKFKLPGF
jgi:hypothetical protein